MQERYPDVQAIFPVVAVPARNEEQRLPQFLAALSAQSWLVGCQSVLPVVVVLNNCVDNSAGAVAATAVGHPNLDVRVVEINYLPKDAHVGSARRLAMDTALSLCADPQRSAILTSDADAIPCSGWIEANLRHLASGVDLVGGLLVGNEAEEAQLGPDFKRRAALHKLYGSHVDRLSWLIDPLEHDPWPHHHDHTGASLAVKADVYRASGGMPPMPSREDLAFVKHSRSHGFLLRHPMDVVVHVSARLVGRAPGGMADCLKDWMRAAAANAPLLVEDPRRILDRFQRRRTLRKQAVAFPCLAKREDFEARRSALGGFEAASRGVSLVERSIPDEPDAPAETPVELALELIGRMIEDAEEDARAA